MNEHRFGGKAERLRSPERVALLEVERVVDLCLEGIDSTSALDVGTGSGIFAEAFAGRGLAVAGIDVNAEMVEAARAYVPQGHFQVAPMEDIPHPDNAFDLVFLGHVLHEADDLLQALREARRVAGQRVAILEWPYRKEEMGPPLDHRLQAGLIVDLAGQAGFSRAEPISLARMDFYRLDPA